MNKKFSIQIDDISKVAGRVVISGRATYPLYTGKLGDLDAYAIRTEPLFPDRAFLSVFGDGVEKLKIGDTLYGE